MKKHQEKLSSCIKISSIFSVSKVTCKSINTIFNLILTVSNPYKYHSFSFIFHLASSLALKGGDSTERGVGLGGGGGAGGAGVGNGSSCGEIFFFNGGLGCINTIKLTN
jgi:hypothetical protein